MKAKRKKHRLRDYFALFTVIAITLAIPVTVIFSHQVTTFQQHAACTGDNLHISGPVRLSTTTIPVGGTITATVTYTNNGSCDIYIRDMAIAGRPPRTTRQDPFNQYGKYAFLPERFNFTIHPGASIIMNGSLTVYNGWPTGEGWYSYAAYQTADGMWHDGDNQNVYFTVVSSNAKSKNYKM